MDIKTLETTEIVSLIEQLNQELKLRADEEKKNLIAEIREKAEALNIPVDELFKEASKIPRKKIGTIKPKYQNPDNKAETWTGRGHKPKWVKAQL